MISRAPWTDEQVSKLNEYQTCDWVHACTCPTHSNRPLIANNLWLYCADCEYQQNWCHSFMLAGAPPHPFIHISKVPT